jgi:hypothetical protein
VCGVQNVSTESKCVTCLQHQQHDTLRPISGRSIQPGQKEDKLYASSVTEALDTVFKSNEDQPVLFPESFYRTPSRSRSRLNHEHSGCSESPPSMSLSTTNSPGIDGTYLAPSHALLRERSYSPMAAGFARLSQKSGYRSGSLEFGRRGRAGGGRSSVEMEAKLFSGPA